VPERLCRFVAGEWEGTPGERFGAWEEARLAFAKEHPNTVLGSGLDVLRANLAEARRLWREGAL
jgi:hypothetical protein